MIYILYLLFMWILVATNKFFEFSQETQNILTIGACICALILPIWNGIRDTVNELKKINKALEKRSEVNANKQ